MRFHGILHDEIGVYTEEPNGEPIYNFSYVDQVYDGLLANGVRPFVELSFMPRQLAQHDIRHTLLVPSGRLAAQGLPPLGCADRQRFARHLVERYGIDEVSQLVLRGMERAQSGLLGRHGRSSRPTSTLYDHTARSLKAVDARLRVGGPATAQAAWVAAFIRYCKQHGVPVDFVSTHVYGDDSPKDVFGTAGPHGARPMVCRAVREGARRDPGLAAAVAAADLDGIQRELRATTRR